MNYGKAGRDLLLDLKRADWLPAYNEDGVRATLQEISYHTDELTDLVRSVNRINGTTMTNSNGNEEQQGQPQQQTVAIENRPAMILHDASIRRNKRCLLAYHSFRIDKLRSLRWETSGILPPAMKSVLSESEIDFFHEYDKLVSRYALSRSSIGTLDWNADRNPPTENFVQVRVVRPGLGSIETEMCGVVELELGTIHYLPRGDVEHLVWQGALVQLSGEESF